MKIAIIGTGRMGKALLKTFYKSYPDSILFSSRSKQKAQEVLEELALNLEVVPLEEALKADIIIPTLWFRDLLPWLQENKEGLKGKILIDITNPFNATFDDFTTAYDTSSAEEVQKIVPQSNVVGAFKNTYWVVFDEPVLQGLKSDIYVTSDDDDARRKVMELLNSLPFRVLDAGMLKNNRYIERMTLLSRELSLKAGNYPRISFNLWGLDHEGLQT
ncbi:NAD(P)-binding domain-containing protein [Rhodocytophaga aerolata]|uniref:NAD(P)-binding domain-containing protein n=1 Tax=Rhodocytophaga aerolata TaxID=455078 RepID=A0ABT8RCR4_9BACT|nr:NAD(P)-binding domain-containing protein [Rhodocytophaga aerolata]MDO1449896.1 NAD(P)-binding domain-containing protein [Rhodocytophaga aerolata]